MEADAVGTFSSEPRHCLRIGAAILGGPGPPSPAIVLGQSTEGGELLEGCALLVAIAVEGGIAAKFRPEVFERPHLETKDGIAVDATLAVERTARSGQALEFDSGLDGTQHLLDAHIEYVSIAAAAG